MTHSNTVKRGQKRDATCLLSTDENNDTDNPRAPKIQRTTNEPNDTGNNNTKNTHVHNNIPAPTSQTTSIETSDDSDEYDSDENDSDQGDSNSNQQNNNNRLQNDIDYQQQSYKPRPASKKLRRRNKTKTGQIRSHYTNPNNQQNINANLQPSYLRIPIQFVQNNQSQLEQNPQQNTQNINANLQPSYLPTQFMQNNQSQLQQNPQQNPQQNQRNTVNSYSDQNKNMSKNKFLHNIYQYGFWVLTCIILLSANCCTSIIYYHLTPQTLSSILDFVNLRKNIGDDYCHDNAEALTAIIFVIFGPMLLFYGKKLIPKILYICGFVPTCLFLYNSTYLASNVLNTAARACIAMLCGSMIGEMAARIYCRYQGMVHIILWGCGWFISYCLWAVFLEDYITSTYNLKDDQMGIVAFAFVSVVGTLVAWFLLKVMEKMFTSLIGAVMTTYALQHFTVKYISHNAVDNVRALVPIGASIQSQLFDLPNEFMGTVIILFIIGNIYQFELCKVFRKNTKETQVSDAPQSQPQWQPQSQPRVYNAQTNDNNINSVSRKKGVNCGMCTCIVLLAAIVIGLGLNIPHTLSNYNTGYFQANQYDFRKKGDTWSIYESYKEIGFISFHKGSNSVSFVENEPEHFTTIGIIKKNNLHHILANGTYIGRFEPDTHNCGYVSCEQHLEFVPIVDKYFSFVSIKKIHSEYTEFEFYESILDVGHLNLGPLAKARIHGQGNGLGKARATRLTLFPNEMYGVIGSSKKEFVRVMISLISRNLYTYEERRTDSG